VIAKRANFLVFCINYRIFDSPSHLLVIKININKIINEKLVFAL